MKKDAVTVEVSIIRPEHETEWSLEVVNSANRSIVWDDLFASFDHIVDHCCDAWNTLIEQPWRIMSIGLRDWAYAS